MADPHRGLLTVTRGLQGAAATAPILSPCSLANPTGRGLNNPLSPTSGVAVPGCYALARPYVSLPPLDAGVHTARGRSQDWEGFGSQRWGLLDGEESNSVRGGGLIASSSSPRLRCPHRLSCCTHRQGKPRWQAKGGGLKPTSSARGGGVDGRERRDGAAWLGTVNGGAEFLNSHAGHYGPVHRPGGDCLARFIIDVSGAREPLGGAREREGVNHSRYE